MLWEGTKWNIFLPSFIREMLLPNKQFSVAGVLNRLPTSGVEQTCPQAQAPPLLAPRAEAWRMRAEEGVQDSEEGVQGLLRLQMCSQQLNSASLAALARHAGSLFSLAFSPLPCLPQPRRADLVPPPGVHSPCHSGTGSGEGAAGAPSNSSSSSGDHSRSIANH